MVCDENSMTRGKPKSVKTAVLAASVAAMMGFGSIAAAADPVIVEGQTYENVSVTESSNHPLKAQVSATADDASSLTVKDSTFRNNSMTLEDTSGGPAAVGVAATGVDVSVSGSTFDKNTVSVAQDGKDTNGIYGAAIGVGDGNLTVTGSDFTGNQAVSKRQTQGAAIYQSVGNITVSDSNFIGNTGSSDGGNVTGGAVSLWGVSGTIDNAHFEGNVASVENDGGNAVYGGAIYTRSGVWGGENDTQLTVSNSTFTGNSAEGSTDAKGGAIYAKGDPDYNDGYEHALNVENSKFEGNHAVAQGGAIYVLDTTTTISGDSSFIGNTAQNGGAIYNEYSGKVAATTSEAARIAISDSTFTGNSATAEGGAIYNTKGSEIVFNGTNTFSGNTANGVANDIYNDGTVTVASGETVLDGGITGKGTVDIDGGKLVAATIHANANAINLKTGTLQTGSDQVMQAALDADGTVTDAVGLKTEAGVTYTGGELALTDAKYNLDYAKSVANAINNNNATNVTMLGELVGQTGPVSVGDLDGAGLGLATVDVVADNGTGLVVGANTAPTGDVNGNDYTDAETHNNSLGAQTLTLDSGGEAVLVTGGKSLTLTGDGSDLVKTDEGLSCTSNIASYTNRDIFLHKQP